MTIITLRMIFLAGLLALALSPAFIWLARRVGFVDAPGTAPHKQHVAPVPIAGSWVLVLTVIVLTLIATVGQKSDVGAILMASVVIFGFGVWDDVKNVSPPVKLLGQGIAAVWVIVMGVHVKLLEPEYNLINWSLSLLWIMGMTNAFNFVDSMDGLAAGLAGLASAFFMLATFDSGQLPLALFSAVLVGTCMGVYFFNSSPAHYFLGDSGAQWLGFCLGSLAIAFNPEGFLRTQSWFVPILLLGVPIFDASLVVVSRMRHGQPVYKGGFDHTYHRLVAFGMSKNRAVLLMHVVALLLGCLAFITIALPPVLANAVYFLCLLLWGGGILFFDHKKRWPISPH